MRFLKIVVTGVFAGGDFEKARLVGGGPCAVRSASVFSRSFVAAIDDNKVEFCLPRLELEVQTVDFEVK